MAEIAALPHRQQVPEPADMVVEIDKLVIDLIWRAAETQAEIDKIGKTIRTADVRWVMGFHIASDLGVLAAIWVLTLYERMPKSKQA